MESKPSATTVSTGSLSLPPALASSSLARSTLSGSTRLLPTGLALGEEEGVGHGAADQQRVALAEQLLDDA